MDHLCALQRDFINLRLGTFIHWNSAAVQFHANPDIIDWEFDLENGGEPRRYPFPESDWALGLMEQCFASHANFMLNLSPDPDGRIPAPLAARFAEIGARVSFPAPLTELPAGWLQR